jgi:hypothetical protein
MEQTPTFRVNVVTRSTSAVNYRRHSGKTELDFRGTEMMPEAKGKVVSTKMKKGPADEAGPFLVLKPGPQFSTWQYPSTRSGTGFR